MSGYTFTQAHWRGCVTATLIDEFQHGRLFADLKCGWVGGVRPFSGALADALWMTSWENWGADE